MIHLKVFKKNVYVNGNKLSLDLIRLENVVFAFLYEVERGLGTLAFAIPSNGRTPVNPVVLIGSHYQLLSKILAERISNFYQIPVLVFVRLKVNEEKSLIGISKLIRSLPELKYDNS